MDRDAEGRRADMDAGAYEPTDVTTEGTTAAYETDRTTAAYEATTYEPEVEDIRAAAQRAPHEAAAVAEAGDIRAASQRAPHVPEAVAEEIADAEDLRAAAQRVPHVPVVVTDEEDIRAAAQRAPHVPADADVEGEDMRASARSMLRDEETTRQTRPL